MTWFISTSDIIGLVCLIAWALLSLISAIKMVELLKASTKGAFAWCVVGLFFAVAYGAPIVYIGRSILP